MKGNFKRKVSILLLFLCFCMTKSTWANVQCDLEFEHSVEAKDNSPEGAIYVALKGDPSIYTFKLYDLYQGKVIEEKVLSNLSKGSKTLLFDNVPASTYTIYVSRNGCDNHITLGGSLGIIVGQ